MKDFKILIVVIFVTGLIYWGVEPLAHSQMHPHVEPADYTFKDLPESTSKTPDVAKGQELVMGNCVACHSITAADFPPVLSEADAAAAYGVVPPDLSSAGLIYNANFLANLIKDPAVATKLTHKFKEEEGIVHPMVAYKTINSNEDPNAGPTLDEDVTNMVAYLQSIAPKSLSNKEVFTEACGRCHSMKYDKWQALTPEADLKRYLNVKIPDLSIMIRSRSTEYLHNFINDPQKLLAGTAMPRVGLTQEAETQVIAYMESVGDSKKSERDSLGWKIVVFFLIMGGVAYLWKNKIWRDLH